MSIAFGPSYDGRLIATKVGSDESGWQVALDLIGPIEMSFFTVKQRMDEGALYVLSMWLSLV